MTGHGGVVAELEDEIAGLLGKPAPVYLPSGTMAQQSVLRVHADRRQRRAVVYHPLCHLDRHEDRAFQAPADARLPRPRPRDRVGPARGPGVRIVPDPPQVSMMHLLLAVTQEGFAAAAGRLAAEQGVWTWPQAMITSDPGVQRVELYVGDATRAVPPDKVRDIVVALTAS